MHRVVALTALAWGLGHLIQAEIRVALPLAVSAAADKAAPSATHGFGTVTVEALDTKLSRPGLADEAP